MPELVKSLLGHSDSFNPFAEPLGWCSGKHWFAIDLGENLTRIMPLATKI
jgi:hypothetical protein